MLGQITGLKWCEKSKKNILEVTMEDGCDPDGGFYLDKKSDCLDFFAIGSQIVEVIIQPENIYT